LPNSPGAAVRGLHQCRTMGGNGMRRADRIAQTGKHGRPLRLMSRIAPSSARSRASCTALPSAYRAHRLKVAFAQKLTHDVGHQEVVVADK
jgi:hypothetical protein